MAKHSLTDSRKKLKKLADALRARYYDVDVVSAEVVTLKSGALQQCVHYRASLSVLTRHPTLLTDEMLKDRDAAYTSIGDIFSLMESSDDPELWDLTIYTATYPREHGRLGVSSARRLLEQKFSLLHGPKWDWRQSA